MVRKILRSRIHFQFQRAEFSSTKFAGRVFRVEPFWIVYSIDISGKKAHDHSMRSQFLVDRRTCLKGIGVSLALPLLESMGWAEPTNARPYRAPVRLGFMYM